MMLLSRFSAQKEVMDLAMGNPISTPYLHVRNFSDPMKNNNALMLSVPHEYAIGSGDDVTMHPGTDAREFAFLLQDRADQQDGHRSRPSYLELTLSSKREKKMIFIVNPSKKKS